MNEVEKLLEKVKLLDDINHKEANKDAAIRKGLMAIIERIDDKKSKRDAAIKKDLMEIVKRINDTIIKRTDELFDNLEVFCDRVERDLRPLLEEKTDCTIKIFDIMLNLEYFVIKISKEGHHYMFKISLDTLETTFKHIINESDSEILTEKSLEIVLIDMIIGSYFYTHLRNVDSHFYNPLKSKKGAIK